MPILEEYFPDISPIQIKQYYTLYQLYTEWNNRINVVSRKDIDELMTRHVLHSMGIAKVQPFKPGAKVVDVGTGGGFPGIPLAILFPETSFLLVDSIGKKIRVVNEVTDALGLKNVVTEHNRVEQVTGQFDFIVSRAVARMETFVYWTRGKISPHQKHELHNGILYLKGGDLSEELLPYPHAKQYPLNHYFHDPFFETKTLVHLPLSV
jgi:16S rRNA (guanine527-N7)-methyltransferase